MKYSIQNLRPLTLRHYSVWPIILLQVISMSDHESYRMATHPLPFLKGRGDKEMYEAGAI